VEYIKTAWKKVNPLHPFELRFFEEDFEQMYRSDEQMRRVLNYAALLAILIASIGLYGLAAFMAEKRTKEIGIRKVLGASVWEVILILSKEFVRWVMIANVIAWPLAYIVMNRWLEDHAYRISISGWVFVATGLITVFMALATVGYQSLKAALADPIKSIRYE
jgi:putative ABC transport system permease protein